MTLADRLRKRIEAEGPISFKQWMDACLYDSEAGYYMRPERKTGAGDDADFATSPTLHPFMAQCVANEARATWERLGKPSDFTIVEFGGGEGDLARDALAHLAPWQPKWLHVERSPSHQAAQTGAFGHVTEIPAGTVGFVIAHEFLDALAFNWLEMTESGWKEVHVDHNFQEVLGQPAPEAMVGTGEVPVGERLVVMTEARRWWQDLSALSAGAVIVIDYGSGPTSEVRTFANHQHAGSPLDAPGTKDITANVDFGKQLEWAEESGFEGITVESQESFLVNHGALEALNEIDRNSVEGAKAYLRLRQMLLPHAGGMGRAFRVLKAKRSD